MALCVEMTELFELFVFYTVIFPRSKGKLMVLTKGIKVCYIILIAT